MVRRPRPQPGVAAARGDDLAPDAGVGLPSTALVLEVHRPVRPGLLGRGLRADDLRAGHQRHRLRPVRRQLFVRVEWFREGTALRVEVHDPGFPVNVRLCRPDAEETHGRGLLLVDAIADSWHVGLSPFGGTVVSFIVAEAWPD